jgi:muramoyltetrapeptide carboxypeptidase
MEDCFADMLDGRGEGTGWRQLPDKDPVNKNLRNAVLWGGNLSMLVALIGTPYFPQIRGGVLFLEDVGEHPYRIERMLSQLLHAGVLAGQKAIVFGQFTGFALTPHDRGFKLGSVVQWLRTQVKVPVLTNLPYGHVQTKVLLPVGAHVDMLLEDRDVLMLWGHEHEKREASVT